MAHKQALKWYRTREGLRTVIGLGLVASHFLAMVYSLTLTLQYLHFDEALDLVLILAPLFSMFTLAIVRHSVSHQTIPADRTELSFMFCTISLAITFFFIAAIFVLITAFPLKIITSLDQLKKGVGLCEVLIATYLGLIVESLFPVPKHQELYIDPTTRSGEPALRSDR